MSNGTITNDREWPSEVISNTGGSGIVVYYYFDCKFLAYHVYCSTALETLLYGPLYEYEVRIKRTLSPSDQ